MANGEIILCFQKLGLSEYESKALSALLTRHDATAQQIADSGEIPITKVYSVLSSLEKQGLVKCTLERPKKYRPLDPEALMEIILGKRKAEIEILEKSVAKKLDVLKEMYTQGEGFQGQEKVWYLPSFEAVWNMVHEITVNCKKNIHVIADNCIWKHTLTDDKLMKLGIKSVKEGGIHCYCIIPSTFSQLFKEVGSIPKGWLKFFASERTRCRIIDDNKLYHNIIIKDEENVGMSFKDVKSKKICSGIAIFDKLVTQGTLDYFNSLWYSAMPVENEIQREAQRVLERMEQKRNKKKIAAKL